MLRLKKKPKAGGSGSLDVCPPRDTPVSMANKGATIEGPAVLAPNVKDNDQMKKPPGDDSSKVPLQSRSHPMAKNIIKEYIVNEPPTNPLCLSEMEICNQLIVWGHIQSVMDKLESHHDVPSGLRDSETEPDPSDVLAFVDHKVKWAMFSHRWPDLFTDDSDSNSVYVPSTLYDGKRPRLRQVTVPLEPLEREELGSHHQGSHYTHSEALDVSSSVMVEWSGCVAQAGAAGEVGSARGLGGEMPE
ncbi:hypothetical protein HD554DRAFT_2137369 [Boletus coccyginus]|nr:hypothetical protein HD554DRAFT_2137369 [Boletus coccyginus]